MVFVAWWIGIAGRRPVLPHLRGAAHLVLGLKLSWPGWAWTGIGLPSGIVFIALLASGLLELVCGQWLAHKGHPTAWTASLGFVRQEL